MIRALRAAVAGWPLITVGPPRWMKSSFCQGGECAEIAEHDGRVWVRNSTRPRRLVGLPPDAFRELVAAAKAGELDSLRDGGT